jgi:phosphatidylinositol alpha-1,6-mannosyltransferase
VSRLTGIPYLTCAYGIECWGKLSLPEEHALKRSQRILSISHWTKKLLVDRGYREEQIAIIHPRMPTSLEKLAPPAAKPGARRPFRLLTVSRLDAREAYKGQDHVIEALSRIRMTEPKLEIHYTILGKGTDEARLRELVRHHDLESVVEFRPPFADREELAAAYRACDVYVMPSRFGRWGGRYRGEGFGIVYVEAAAFGVPSIAYACGGAMDIIHDGIDGYLITPDDIGELARRIAALAKDPRRITELGQAAYASAMKAFTRAAIRREIETALSGLARPRTINPPEPRRRPTAEGR